MYLIDYHNHTRVSHDSEAILTEMAQAAVDAGLSEMCITDHYDTLTTDGSTAPGYSWIPSLTQFEPVRDAFAGKLKIKLGMEFGSGHLGDRITPNLPPQVDFLLGSLHNKSPKLGGGDFYFVHYDSVETAHQMLDDYFDSMAILAPLPCYDALAHLPYPLRYCRRDGLPEISLAPYWERIDAILKTVIETGHGIEVNTYNGRSIEEWRPILTHYRSLGGEYVCTGSDAHRPENMGKGIAEATELLKETGFRYLTTYQQRKPVQIKL